MHEKPDLDSKDGSGYTRFDRYQDLSIYLLGKRAGWWALVPFQMMVCVGIMITYTVVGGDDLHAGIEALAPAGSHIPGVWLFYIVFIAVQLVLSMLPDFSSLGVVSLLGALMSAGYCTIAVVLAATAKVPADVVYTPMIALSPIQKVFAMFNALSTIMFAYGGHNMALEIQATLPQPPTVKRMMRGVHIAFVMTGIAYFAVAISGFRALGEASGSNIILTLSNGPAWVRSLARFMVVIHVAAAYQVCAHPAFQSLELWVARRTGGSVAGLKVDYDGGHWATRLVLRTALNLLCLLVASMLPFFGDLMGFVGALAVTPTTFLLPSLLWLYWAKPQRGSVSWGINWLIVVITAIIGVMGAIGSVYSIVLNVRTYKIFSA
jgi:amino acid permease